MVIVQPHLSAQAQTGWQASPETVEKLSKSRPEFNYYEEKVPHYTLPDVLANSAGKKITSAKEWTKVRRQEVLELFRENVYGKVPSTPYTKTFKVVNENKNAMGGAAITRRRLGETVERINTAFPHWFCSNYKKYSDNEDAMPFDMHMLLALIAPRALYIDCASDDLWGDLKGCYISLYNSMPVFKLLRAGFHIRDGVHNMLLKDWNCFMDFADIVWK